MVDGGLIWLASYPKSGNTWLRCLLEAYSTNGHLDINNLRLAFGDSAAQMYQSVCPLNAEKLSDTELYLIRPAALMQAMASFKPPRFVKTHFSNANGENFAPFIPPVLTKSAIYIVRDPRSVAVSWGKHFGLSVDNVVKMMGSNALKLGESDEGQCRVFCGSWSAHVESWISKKSYPVLILKYEDMVERTEEMLKGIVEFLEWEYDEARAKRAIRASSLRKLQKIEDEVGFQERSKHTDRFFSSGGTRWKDELAPKCIRAIEKRHGTTMKKFGYL
jgi:hypothetical protein